jgi:hypothetical protein
MQAVLAPLRKAGGHRAVLLIANLDFQCLEYETEQGVLADIE